METIKVRINSDGVTAREVNHLRKGEMGTFEYFDDQLKWEEAEDKLCTFEIQSYRNSLSGFFIKTYNMHKDNITMFSGKIVEAEILDNDKLIIRIV